MCNYGFKEVYKNKINLEKLGFLIYHIDGEIVHVIQHQKTVDYHADPTFSVRTEHNFAIANHLEKKPDHVFVFLVACKFQ